MNLMRNVARKNEQSFWAPIPQAYGLTRVSLAGSLNGMQSLSRGTRFAGDAVRDRRGEPRSRRWYGKRTTSSATSVWI